MKTLDEMARDWWFIFKVMDKWYSSMQIVMDDLHEKINKHVGENGYRAGYEQRASEDRWIPVGEGDPESCGSRKILTTDGVGIDQNVFGVIEEGNFDFDHKGITHWKYIKGPEDE